MKRYFLVIILLFTMQSLSAQFSVGLRGGLNFTSLPVKTYEVNNARIEALPDSYTGFHIGLITQAKFSGFFIQPELLFVSSGNHFRYEHPDQERDVFFIQRFSKIDFPVLLGLRGGPIRLGLGPVASYIVENSSNILDSEYYTGDTNLSEKFNSLTYGYQFGVGLDIGNIVLDLKYEGSLSNYSEEISIGNSTFVFDTRPRQIIFSIGLLFY
ncbi:MAG: PorT family protein [Bacteroidales bacterium]|nr:PorT family protein [Bacteroidales bacterium]